MALNQDLLSILACPKDKGPLYYFDGSSEREGLYNPRLRLWYSIVDDIPVMLVDEAATQDQTQHDELIKAVEDQGLQLTFEAA